MMHIRVKSMGSKDLTPEVRGWMNQSRDPKLSLLLC